MATDFAPSPLQVDFEKNITQLYEAITSTKWDDAIRAAQRRPNEVKTWVVRHYEEDGETSREVMWRFLPIHSACARKPPAELIAALLKAYPDGAKCVDDQGMYPLHYACGNQASREVIRQLIMAYPEAAKKADPRGMLPIHYVACWGPSSTAVIDMILVANRDVATAQDEDGNTPMDLALEADYPERNAVVGALGRWLKKDGSHVQTLRKLGSRSSAESYKSQILDIQGKLEQLDMSSKDKNTKIAELKNLLRTKAEENDSLREDLKRSNEERDGLRATLAELTDDHEKFKQKTIMIGDRLGSLNASLYGMMEQQNIVMKALRARESQWIETAELRRLKMKELLEIENEIDSVEDNLKESFLAQTKEMEAIQAVIAAVRTQT